MRERTYNCAAGPTAGLLADHLDRWNERAQGLNALLGRAGAVRAESSLWAPEQGDKAAAMDENCSELDAGFCFEVRRRKNYCLNESKARRKVRTRNRPKHIGLVLGARALYM